MAKIRLEEALIYAKEHGRQVLKKDLAAKMWPDSSEPAQQVNMTNLCNGRRTSVEPEWVQIICKECGCTADFLFGIDEQPCE